jgi:hypothetical protein
MKRVIVVATVFLTAAAFATGAKAIDVIVGGEGEVNVIVGAPGAEAGVDAGAAVGAGAGAGVGAGAGANVGAGAGAGVGVDLNAPARTDLQIRTEGGAGATVMVNAVMNTPVLTNDDTRIGVVADVATATDGEALIIVALNDDFLPGVDRIAVRASAVVQTSAGLVIQTTAADLRSSITAGLEVGAGAGAP